MYIQIHFTSFMKTVTCFDMIQSTCPTAVLFFFFCFCFCFCFPTFRQGWTGIKKKEN